MSPLRTMNRNWLRTSAVFSHSVTQTLCLVASVDHLHPDSKEKRQRKKKREAGRGEGEREHETHTQRERENI